MVIALVMTLISLSGLTHSIMVDDEVWIELIRRKYAGRFHNVNDPMREALGLQSEDRDPVRNYSDEGLEYENRIGITKKCRSRPGLERNGSRHICIVSSEQESISAKVRSLS